MNSIHYVKQEGKKGQTGLQGNACSKLNTEGLRRRRRWVPPRGAAWPKAQVTELLGVAFGGGKGLLSPTFAEMGKTFRLTASQKGLDFGVTLCCFLAE